MTRDVLHVRDLEVVRLLTDPFKLELLKVFAAGPATAREVAERLGEKVTRLYRHIDALLEAGLLEVVAEAPKRGTVERTFRAVARRFEVDHRLFGSGAGGADTGQGDEAAAPGDTVAHGLIRGTEAELVRALSAAGGTASWPTLLMRVRFSATEERAAELVESLNEWLESVASEEGIDVGRDYAGLVAIYPLGKEEDDEG
ncbi:MAG TPA: winged helix-turn-helix domain-containing protein [Longimicrobiales bacterium]|nr:winged helix-turn-helix domain-containing protein [Longimicrobiales bacterium]